MEEYVLYIPIVFCNVIISNLTYLGASLLYHQTIMVMLMDKVKMYALVTIDELKKTISYKNRYHIMNCDYSSGVFDITRCIIYIPILSEFISQI